MESDLGASVPKLGFGLMRLPMLGDAVDLPQTMEMADRFLAAGFRYFDTAYGYLNGKSEAAVKTALVERYPREDFLLATKLPVWAGVKTKAAAEQMFYTSLERTGAGYFDYYLLHNLGPGRTEKFEEYAIWDFLAQRRREGLIRHLGFSIHDSAQALDRVLTAHPEAEFVQLQINYADWESPVIQSRRCYETARAHGKPVIVMEPVKGGTLSTLPPRAAAPLLALHPERSLSSWAIRYAASLEGVLTVLSGMSDLAQMDDNLNTMREFQPLGEAEYAALEETMSVLRATPTIPCTGCDYCAKDCPMHVGISDHFRAMNLWKVYGNLPAARRNYEMEIRVGGHAPASACVGCGRCEAVCPQGIPIVEELRAVAAALEG